MGGGGGDGDDDDDGDDDGGGKYDVVLHTLQIHPDGEEAEIEEMGCRLWVVGCRCVSVWSVKEMVYCGCKDYNKKYFYYPHSTS